MYALKSRSKSSRPGLLIRFVFLLSVAAPVIGCESAPTSDDAGTARPDATAEAIAPRQMAASVGESLPEPDGSCLATCLHQWQACVKNRHPRPGASSDAPASAPAQDDCAAAAGQCVSACPAQTETR
jgi:hypothetical protein